MRNVVALVLALAVVGVVAYLLLGGERSRSIDDEPVADSGAKPPAAPSAANPAGGPAPTGGLATARRPGRGAASSPDGGAIRDEGSIRVALKTSDGGPLPDAVASGVRIDIDSLGAGLVAYPLALAQSDGTWLYEAVPVGSYRVRAVVPGFQTGFATVPVKKDEEASADITLAAGAEIQWKATLYSGERPASVRLALIDGRNQSIAFDLDTGTGLIRVLPSTVIDLGPQGKVVGLKPDTYRLRATAPSGESDEQKVEAKAGAAASVELKIRK